MRIMLKQANLFLAWLILSSLKHFGKSNLEAAFHAFLPMPDSIVDMPRLLKEGNSNVNYVTGFVVMVAQQNLARAAEIILRELSSINNQVSHEPHISHL